MKKIVLIGPESTGKTTLAAKLAKQLNTVWVPEFSRDFLPTLDRPYEEEDLITIAKGQMDYEQDARMKMRMKQNAKFGIGFKLKQSHGSLMICDTDLRVLRIWSQLKYGQCHPWIQQQIADAETDLYLLCKPDLPWEPDPLRESPDSLQELYEMYKEDLIRDSQPFAEVEGIGEARLRSALRALNDL
jgi:NadR type nicotinamide-nucleotide adenylyltransferase